jgi:hypothetical protein
MLPPAGTIEIEVKVEDWTVSDVLPVIELEVAEIVSEPRARAVTSPPALIDATLWFEELQVTDPVMSFVL